MGALNKQLIMRSVPPILLFLVLFVQACTAAGEPTLPSLSEAVQLLQLETIRGLEQTILEKEDENRRLEEIIRNVEMEKEAVTHNNTMMEEENVKRMFTMESEKTQMREEFVKMQMERDAGCQDEKREIEDIKNKELDEISERLDQSEMIVTYMSTVMIHSNQMVEEQENLLKVQAGVIQEFNEEVEVGKNCSTLLGAAADRIFLQEEAINLWKSSVVTSRNFSELSTSGMDQLDVAPFMMEMLESYNKLTQMVENMKTALEKEGLVEAQTSELLTHLADLRSAMESSTINMDTLEQQAQMIETQGRSIALLTPLLHLSNSSDILWFDSKSRSSSSNIGDVGFADVAAMCSCLPRSASTNQLLPVRIDYQCQQGDTNRSFQLACPGGVCSSGALPSCTDSLEWEEEEVRFEKCQELSFKGASVLCGANGTKKTTRRLEIGGSIVEEVVSVPCNDCGDLSAALEWTAWAPCVNDTSGRVIEGMICRRRGNTYIGFEEEEKDFTCEAPWTPLSTGCYRFHESPLTQSEAVKFCRDEQQVPAHLVEIESAEENSAIIAEIQRRNFVSRKIEFWLGITDRQSEGQWVLESTGKNVNFTNWRSGDPNNKGNEDCAHINGKSGTWNDYPCTYKTGPYEWMRTALCEKEI